MKSVSKLIGVYIIAISCLFSCSVGLSEQESNVLLSANEEAVVLAKAFLKSGNVQASDSEWGDRGEISATYPIYIEGIDEVSYYECKVTVDGLEAGYILVNVNQTDVPVPSYSTSGVPNTESMIGASGNRSGSVKVFRYSPFQYLALDTKSRGSAQVVSQMGFGDISNHEEITEERTLFVSEVKKYGTAIGVEKEELIESMNIDTSRGYSRWCSDELNYTFSGGWHLPHWRQTMIEVDGKEVKSGCGPVALAMIYAYWRQFKGKDKLFNGENLNDYDTAALPNSAVGQENYEEDYWLHYNDTAHSEIISVIKEIGDDIGTKYTATNSTTVGLYQRRVENYPDSKGYDFKADVDFGGEWRKGMKAYKRIRDHDQPLLWGMASKPGGYTDHYVAIEGVKFKEYVRGRRHKRYYNREMWHLANFGLGNKREWICTYYRGNRHKERRSFDIYHIWER